MFIAALFTIARTWKQPRFPSADEWIKKLWYYTMEYYSAIKRNAFESVLIRWMKIEPIIQSEKVKVKVTQLCPILVTPWTVACQAPLSMESSRKEYWNGLPFPSPVDLPDLGIYPESPALKADSLPSEPPGTLISIKLLKIKCVKRINMKGKFAVFE